jgi:hypothetical protein
VIDPSKPTSARPGSQAKIEVLAARLAAGRPLFHPGDATMREREPHPLSEHPRLPLPDGVTRYRYRGKIRYRARITIVKGSREKVSLGVYDTVEEAEAAVNAARRRNSRRRRKGG